MDTIDVPKASVAFLLAIAIFAALVSFFGCCGAVKESPCLLQTVREFNVVYCFECNQSL